MRHSEASIYCLFENGVPTLVGRTTGQVAERAERHQREGIAFNSFSTLETLTGASDEQILRAESRWLMRLGMDPVEPEQSGTRGALELLCVLAIALIFCV
jgi:hypothetical protein